MHTGPFTQPLALKLPGDPPERLRPRPVGVFVVKNIVKVDPGEASLLMMIWPEETDRLAGTPGDAPGRPPPPAPEPAPPAVTPTSDPPGALLGDVRHICVQASWSDAESMAALVAMLERIERAIIETNARIEWQMERHLHESRVNAFRPLRLRA
ncbi:MAG: hypothetical protein WDN25_03815 [Acetobacteraceae bacterium]